MINIDHTYCTKFKLLYEIRRIIEISFITSAVIKKCPIITDGNKHFLKIQTESVNNEKVHKKELLA